VAIGVLLARLLPTADDHRQATGVLGFSEGIPADNSGIVDHGHA
jgi:hypothetical protein